MNNTNRGLNRTFLFLIGLIVLLLGLAAVALAAIAAVTDAWETYAPEAETNVNSFLESTPLGTTGQSWIWIAVIAACVLLIVLLLVFVFRQGHGHTAHLLSRRSTTDDAGTVGIEAAVAEQALSSALAGRPELISSHVSTYRVKKQPVLKISATARRGVSPRDLTVVIERLVRSWDSLLGEEIPVLVLISGGFRTRVSKPTRLQ